MPKRLPRLNRPSKQNSWSFSPNLLLLSSPVLEDGIPSFQFFRLKFLDPPLAFVCFISQFQLTNRSYWLYFEVEIWMPVQIWDILQNVLVCILQIL